MRRHYYFQKCHRKHALKLVILLKQNARVKLDILPEYEQANQSSDQTSDMVYMESFVVWIWFPLSRHTFKHAHTVNAD